MNGILLIDKPAGPTSHDVVDIIRKRFKIKKVGHAGTLDPAATGLLVILIGAATKASGRLLGGDKEYEVTCLLGVRTDTDDTAGKIKSRQDNITVSRQQVEQAMEGFRGQISQRVPRYSAVKVNGKKLYELARQGRQFSPPEKEVTVYELGIIEFNLPNVHLRIKCSKGTYVRSLCRDLGELLGCGGCAAALRRLRSEPFSVKDAVKLDEVKKMTDNQLLTLLKPAANDENL